MNTIEALKANKVPFGLMEPELQEAAKRIGKSFFDWWVAGDWTDCHVKQFRSGATYRLRPDYEDEPDVVRCKIEIRDGIWKWLHPTNGWTKLHLALNSIGFEFENGNIHMTPTHHNGTGYVNRDDILSGKVQVVHATHVLFSK